MHSLCGLHQPLPRGGDSVWTEYEEEESVRSSDTEVERNIVTAFGVELLRYRAGLQNGQTDLQSSQKTLSWTCCTLLILLDRRKTE